MRGGLSKGLKIWKQVAGQSKLSATLTLAGDQDLLEAARRRFASEGDIPGIWGGSLAELDRFSSVPGELLVVLVDTQREEAVVRALACSRPRGGAVIAVNEGAAATGRGSYVTLRCQRLSFADTPRGWECLFGACAEVARDYAIALGRTYPALRRAVARRVIERTAVENGLIGLAVFVPGADLPIMTLNQVRMILSLADLFGEEVHWDRIPELAMVVGSGVGFRAVARFLVRLFPGVGGLVKGGTGYAGTLALGWGAVRYFESGAPAALSRLAPVLAKLRKP